MSSLRFITMLKKTNKLKIAKNTKTEANRYGGKITRTLFWEGGTWESLARFTNRKN